MGCAGKVSYAGGTWTKSSATLPLPLPPLFAVVLNVGTCHALATCKEGSSKRMDALSLHKEPSALSASVASFSRRDPSSAATCISAYHREAAFLFPSISNGCVPQPRCTHTVLWPGAILLHAISACMSELGETGRRRPLCLSLHPWPPRRWTGRIWQSVSFLFSVRFSGPVPRIPAIYAIQDSATKCPLLLPTDRPRRPGERRGRWELISHHRMHRPSAMPVS